MPELESAFDNYKLSRQVPQPKAGAFKSQSSEAPSPDEQGKLKEIASEFEAIFVELMLGAMRKSIPSGGLINGGNAEDIYRGMLDSEYAKIIAKQDSGGLAAMIEKQLLQLNKPRALVNDDAKNSNEALSAYKKVAASGVKPNL